MDAVRPEVKDGNDVVLRRARHPVLVLRGVKPVPNNVQLTGDQPALVISGPNAGGKTVVLKVLLSLLLLSMPSSVSMSVSVSVWERMGWA